MSERESSENEDDEDANEITTATSSVAVERKGELDNDERNRIIGRWQAGQSRHEISRQTGVSTSAISRLITKFQTTGKVNNLPRKGRPLNIQESDRNALIELAKTKKAKSWTFEELMKSYEQLGHPPIKSANARRILKLNEIKLLKQKPGMKKKQKILRQKLPLKKNNVVESQAGENMVAESPSS